MQKDLAPDIELNLKKKARRRLVGAVTLFLLLVALLPFVLQDRAALTNNDDVEIVLESNESVIDDAQAYEELVAKSDFDSKVKPEPQRDAIAVVLPNKASKTVENKKVEIAEVKRDPAADQAKANALKTTSKPAVKAEKKVADKKVISQQRVKDSKQAIKKTAVVKAEKSAKPTNAPVTKHQSSKRFYVQVGAFSDVQKVKVLQKKMAELGYQSRTEQIKKQDGTLVRLQSTSFTSRNEAMIALQNMKDAGLSGVVLSQ